MYLSHCENSANSYAHREADISANSKNESNVCQLVGNICFATSITSRVRNSTMLLRVHSAARRGRVTALHVPTLSLPPGVEMGRKLQKLKST
ncbi:hypothetical protein J6590_100794 [Homalodisca vitripennis]|nr:hypothetical protein J6590_100794 [Homalodisca vitripennis]